MLFFGIISVRMSEPVYTFPKYRFVPESVPAVVAFVVICVLALTVFFFVLLQRTFAPHLGISYAASAKSQKASARSEFSFFASPTPTSTPTPTATPTPTPTPTPAFFPPVRLRIPTLGIDTGIEYVGTTAEGAMDTPKDYNNVAWYALGPKPGEEGTSVIAGHLDTSTGSPAVFYYLASLPIGERFEIVDVMGQVLVFRTVDQRTYAESAFPIDEVFNERGGPRRLNLITCQGVWDHGRATYTDRLVVYAVLE